MEAGVVWRVTASQLPLSPAAQELSHFMRGRPNAGIQEGFAFISWFRLCHLEKKMFYEFLARC